MSYKTFKEVHISTRTVARWFKCVLELSGNDSRVFRAHSYRTASASAAFDKECSLKHILITANLKSYKNFWKFSLDIQLVKQPWVTQKQSLQFKYNLNVIMFSNVLCTELCSQTVNKFVVFSFLAFNAMYTCES